MEDSNAAVSGSKDARRISSSPSPKTATSVCPSPPESTPPKASVNKHSASASNVGSEWRWKELPEDNCMVLGGVAIVFGLLTLIEQIPASVLGTRYANTYMCIPAGLLVGGAFHVGNFVSPFNVVLHWN